DGYDVVVEGDSHGGFGSVRPPVTQWQEAGATWWVESWWDLPEPPDGRRELRRRLALGPRR
ncbi:MAG: LLM class flavin-dependent oxidoreductase, partial [Phycicoccus sp.]